MIELTRLNGKPVVLNSELIVSLEATPDTVIALTSGLKLMVRESVQEVMERALQYRKRCMQEPLQTWISPA